MKIKSIKIFLLSTNIRGVKSVTTETTSLWIPSVKKTDHKTESPTSQLTVPQFTLITDSAFLGTKPYNLHSRTQFNHARLLKEHLIS